MQQVLQAAGPPSPEALQRIGATAAELESLQAAETLRIADEIAEEVRKRRPDFVGFKLWNGDGFSGSVAIAERVRQEAPGVKLYAGGPHASWFRDLIYKHTDVFDAIVYGEGERAILSLADHASGKVGLADIPGIIHRENGDTVVNPPGEWLRLDDLPSPVYDEDLYPAMAGDEKMKIVVLDDSRGCPYACAFCTHPIESGRKLRTRSAARLIDDMEGIVSRHGVHAFRFAGSSTPGSLMAEAAREIIKRGLEVDYTSFGHFGSAEPEHFRMMRESGLFALFYGIETGCQELLDRAVGKGLDLERVRETIREAKAAGIFVVCSMIVPLPFETEETLAQSLQFLLDVRPDSVPVQPPGILPMTPWLEESEKYGIEVDKDSYLHENVAYKIKLLLPMAFWQPLPYKINGMSFHEFTKLTTRFAAQLEENGILVGLPDDNALISHLAGMPPRQFRDAARAWCVTGDAEAMAELVRRVNRASLRDG